MGHKRDVPCNEPGCGMTTSFWRQCPWALCSLNIGYCDAHGGDKRAEEDMRKHLEHHPTRND